MEKEKGESAKEIFNILKNISFYIIATALEFCSFIWLVVFLGFGLFPEALLFS